MIEAAIVYVIERQEHGKWCLCSTVYSAIAGEITPLRKHDYLQEWLDFIEKHYPPGNYRLRRAK